MSRSDEPRSSVAVGWEWASRVLTVGLEFALPPLLGARFDHSWATSPWGVLIGAVLGFAVGMWHLLQIAREGTQPRAR